MIARRMPPVYAHLTEEQLAGDDYILPGLPATAWRADFGEGALSQARTVKTETYIQVSPKHRDQATWSVLQDWKRLSKLGFVPVSQEPYPGMGPKEGWS